VISRGSRDPWSLSNVKVVAADPTQSGDWQALVDGTHGVINLAGARLVEPPKRWTSRQRAILRASRVDTTARLAEAVLAAPTPPGVFLSGSAVGYYGNRGDEPVGETAGAGTDFLARLCEEWETAARPAARRTRVVWLRTGLVLAANDGFLAPMLPFFRLGLGTGWADGSGWLSWIHRADEVGLIQAALDDERYAGALNCTAPEPVTVAQFTELLAAALRRPTFLPNIPGALLRVGLGEAADVLLHLQRVLPERALQLGYPFRHPTLAAALRDVLA
jgi:hypothetical protein